jgi:hypothetical protein
MDKMILDRAIVIADAGSVSELRCPRCGSQYLHHEGVTLFHRSEDAPSAVRITVAGLSVTTDVVPSSSENPSSRRNGLSVQFSCEGCGGGSQADTIELTLAQHKGWTEIGWRYTPRQASSV